MNDEYRLRKCCPDCGSLRIVRRKFNADYVCYACGFEGNHYSTRFAKDRFPRSLEAIA